MNIYETVTARILSQLDAGVVPWRKTWTTGLPKSLTTGKEYRGVNILILGTAPFSSRYWVTYWEAQRLGGHVRRGERASPVVFWKWRTPQELARLREKSGREDLAPCVPFSAAVFNLDQVEGVSRPEDDVPNRSNDRFEVADKMLDVMPDQPEIVHVATREPSYSPRFDRVTLPHLSQFESAAEYYATLFHELVHATGHPKRLDRFGRVNHYLVRRHATEELVAEFGSAFLCATTRTWSSAVEARQAAYIQGWVGSLRGDPLRLARVLADAQRAAEFILGKIPIAAGHPDRN